MNGEEMDEVASAAVEASGFDPDRAVAVVTVVRLTESGDYNSALTWSGPDDHPADALMTADAAALRRHADQAGMDAGRYWKHVGGLLREAVTLDESELP